MDFLKHFVSYTKCFTEKPYLLLFGQPWITSLCGWPWPCQIKWCDHPVLSSTLLTEASAPWQWVYGHVSSVDAKPREDHVNITFQALFPLPTHLLQPLPTFSQATGMCFRTMSLLHLLLQIDHPPLCNWPWPLPPLENSRPRPLQSPVNSRP